MATRYEKERRRKRRRAREDERRRAFETPSGWRGRGVVTAFCTVAITSLVVYILVTGDFSILERNRW